MSRPKIRIEIKKEQFHVPRNGEWRGQARPRWVKMETKGVQMVNDTATGAAALAMRKATGYSIDDFAKKMGIEKMYLSLLERGMRSWTPKLVTDFGKAHEFFSRGS